MPLFRKKPVVISAEQYIPGARVPDGVVFRENPTSHGDGVAVIVTMEGDMTVSAGDWVITGVKGEHYPCKPDIFAATYDPVE